MKRNYKILLRKLNYL
ncbi:MAG: hypothetical protein ACRBDX_08120, partial [Gammaproteobacteria bacterium]